MLRFPPSSLPDLAQFLSRSTRQPSLYISLIATSLHQVELLSPAAWSLKSQQKEAKTTMVYFQNHLLSCPLCALL